MSSLVIVTGSRDYPLQEKERFQRWIRRYCNVALVFFGGCAKGPDAWLFEMAQEEDLEVEVFPVTEEDWQREGRKAGPLRNRRMVEAALARAREGNMSLLCLAFWDRKSKGTKNTIDLCLAEGIPVIVIPPSWRDRA